MRRIFELEAYLERIGLSGRPGLAEVHRAHSTSIPFEGLDPHLGRRVALGGEELAQKLVERRRGGYCFEQNLLLKAALEALGLRVELFLARVLLGVRPGESRGRTHLLLRVTDGDGQSWHADVGFGGGTLLEPLPWGPGGEREQSGWRFRVLERPPEWILQTLEGDAWIDVYAFLPIPVLAIDVELSNWWTSTHPGSPFVTGFLVSRQWPDGRRLILSDWGELALLERTPAGTVSTPLPRERVPELLQERFELPGFALGPDGRLAAAR
ncbi:MAG: arylamine N-acetyltransferase family protein [Solirubrobacteraceae bacterium]